MLLPLDPIVALGRPLVRRILNYVSHVLRCIKIIQMQHKPLMQVLHGFRKETRQTRFHHLLDGIVNVFVIFSDDEECLDDEVQVQAEWLTFEGSTHNLNHFFSQLEVGSFKFHIVGRRYVKNEAKIDMYKISFVVDEDIAVVSIFDLKHIRHNTVGCLRFYEVVSSLLKIQVVLRTKFIYKVFVK